MLTNQRKYIAIGSSLVFILILFGLSGEDQVETSEVYIVQAIESKSEVVERGLVVSDDVEVIRAGASGVFVEMSDSGGYVKKGEQLFRMDSSEPETWYEDAQERINTLLSDKSQVEQELTVVQLEERNTKLIKKEDLALAKLKLELEEMGLSSRTRRILEIDLKLSEIDVTESEEALEREKRLFEKGLASRLDVDEAKRRLITKKAKLEEQRIAKTLQEQGAVEEILEEMRTHVSMQEFLVERSNTVSESRIKRIKNRLKTIDKRLSVERKDMTISGAQVKGATAYATRDGIAINKGYKDWRNAGRWVPNTVGSKRYIGDVIFEIIDPTKMRIETLISELDYSLVEQGQNVEIFIPALKNKHYTGVLDYIGGIGRDRSDASILSDDIGKTDITVYNAVVKFDNSDEHLRPGMSAVIRFPATHTKTKILIPKEYTKHVDGNSYLVLSKNGSAQNEISISGVPKGAHYISVNEGLVGGESLIRWREH